MVTKRSGVLCGFLLIAGFAMAQYSWIRRSDFSLPARVQSVGFSLNGKGYIAGGTTGATGSILSDLQEYDPVTGRWQTISSLPVPLRGAAAFTINNQAFIVTGASSSGMNRQLLIWDQSANNWKTGPAFPEGYARLAAVGIGLGNRGYIATGYDMAEQPLDDIWEYNPFDQTWIRKASLPGGGRSYATGFAIHHKVYIGLGSVGGGCLKDWWEFTPETNNWKRMADLPGQARTGAMGFTANGKGYIVGGINLDLVPLNDVWEFDPVHNTWMEVTPFPGAGRGYGSGFHLDDHGYITAGTSSESYLSEVWECYPAQLTQTAEPEEMLESAVMILPNPFFYRFCLKMRHPYTGLLEITIRSMDGRLMFRRSFNKEAEYIVQCWEIDFVSQGYFLFQIRDASGTVDIRQKVIHKSFDN